jgi:transcriptional regulator GlxA family with amidase domain
MARVIAVVFDDVQMLDVCGPAAVFAAARSRGRPAYELSYASVAGGPRRMSSGLCVATRDLTRMRLRTSDIVLVPGGDEPALLDALSGQVLERWLQRAARTVQRVASVCSGAFLLAVAGLLDGKRATTHWRARERLARDFPNVQVDASAIYVHQGRIWTSAGVTTGIDMALAMVEQDLGRAEVDRLAGELVLYVRRPGFQSQFSAALVAQTASSAELAGALEWARGHMADVGVEGLAKRAGVSLRTLHRLCREQLDTTPGKLLERLRVEQARALLSTSSRSLKLLASACGFGNSTRMKRAFMRELGMGPREYRLLHSSRRAEKLQGKG